MRTKSALKEPPYAIMTNVPDSFFKDNGISTEAYVRFYLQQANSEEAIFYHFISSVPVHPVHFVYICFAGKVQLKVGILEFRKNQPLLLPTYQHPEPRNWMVTCAPVIKAPKDMPMRGFRGFRYVQELF